LFQALEARDMALGIQVGDLFLGGFNHHLAATVILCFQQQRVLATDSNKQQQVEPFSVVALIQHLSLL
jgi:hypothetical protein